MAKRSTPTKRKIGQLPPRYRFAINPYTDARFSKCPKCNRATDLRKFPLLIHIEEFGLVVLGKTCRYCPRCEFIIAHQDELEHELAIMFSARAPEVIGNDYFVLGTVDKKAWRKGMEKPGALEETLEHTADIKTHMTLHYEPARWVRTD